MHRLLVTNGIRPETLCDVGCGTGAVLEHLAGLLPASTRLVGYEPSAQALALAPERRSQAVSLVLGDGLADDETFDLMLMLDVFEHVEDYFGLLRRSVRKARWAVFHIPLDVSVQAVLRAKPFLAAREQLGHLHFFTRETALATLADTGFDVLDERFTAGRLELAMPSTAARLARLPRGALWRVSPGWAARLLGGFSLLVLARGKATSLTASEPMSLASENREDPVA